MGGCLSGVRRSKKPESLDEFTKVPVSTRVNTWLAENEFHEEPGLQSHYSISDLRRASEQGSDHPKNHGNHSRESRPPPEQLHLQKFQSAEKNTNQNYGLLNTTIQAEIENQLYPPRVEDRHYVTQSPNGNAYFCVGNNVSGSSVENGYTEAQSSSPMHGRIGEDELEIEPGKPISAGGDSQLADYISANEQFDLSPTRRAITPPEDRSAHEYLSIVDKPSNEFLLVLDQAVPEPDTSTKDPFVDEDNNSLNPEVSDSPEPEEDFDVQWPSVPIISSFDYKDSEENHNHLSQTPKLRSLSDECRRLCPMPTPIRTNVISPSCYEKMADENGRVLTTNIQFRQVLEETKKSKNGALCLTKMES